MPSLTDCGREASIQHSSSTSSQVLTSNTAGSRVQGPDGVQGFVHGTHCEPGMPLSRTIKEWYAATPADFKKIVPKPVMCHLNGQNIYKKLVRAKVPT